MVLYPFDFFFFYLTTYAQPRSGSNSGVAISLFGGTGSRQLETGLLSCRACNSDVAYIERSELEGEHIN